LVKKVADFRSTRGKRRIAYL
jgi:hypothetical protein